MQCVAPVLCTQRVCPTLALLKLQTCRGIRKLRGFQGASLAAASDNVDITGELLSKRFSMYLEAGLAASWL